MKTGPIEAIENTVQKGNRMMTDDQKETIIRILMAHIECTGYSNRRPIINIQNGAIQTTQTYYPYKEWKGKKVDIPLDPDMSDFAVGFYKIIYKNILENSPVIDEKDQLFNRNFAGDTMNSFNTIANSVPGAGGSKTQRTPKYQWPQWLQDYHTSYHCLANFWLIPMEVGRTLKNEWSKGRCDNNVQDYMDRFLMVLKQHYTTYQELYRDYFQKIGSFKEFAKVHILLNSYVDKNYEIYKFSTPDTKQGKIGSAVFKMLKKRADMIADSDCAEKLLSYFEQNSLLS